jgi:hypothetical protein
MSTFSRIQTAALLAIAVAAPMHLPAQNARPTELKFGDVVGTVMDENGNTVANATVVLREPDRDDRRTVVTGENGFFQFSQVQPGVPYQINISTKDFADWTLPAITVEPGQFKIVSGIQLRIPAEHTEIQVTYDHVQVAEEQLHREEKQRVLGIVPNFYVTYESNPAPLTSRMKFALALKLATDPVTAVGVGVVSAAKQGGNTPDYGQGWDAYGKRVGTI